MVLMKRPRFSCQLPVSRKVSTVPRMKTFFRSLPPWPMTPWVPAMGATARGSVAYRSMACQSPCPTAGRFLYFHQSPFTIQGRALT